MTSDQFFKKNKFFFDVIFIDGYHEYYQCQRDVINSIKYLNLGGIIILHDCIPKNSYEEAMPQKQNASTGNVWKVCVELSQSKNIDFVIANTDSGIGIIKIRKKFQYKYIPNLGNLNFEHFVDKYYKILPIVSSEEALDFIDKK
jgi:predicted O-methyltransferase YrrM